MKNSRFISVKKNCTEKFSNFSTTANGGFCTTCKKEVINFTTMPQKQVLDYLSKNSTTICGRFKTSQLETRTTPENYHAMPNFIPKGIGALSFLLISLCTVSKMEAQELSLHSSIQTELTYSSTVTSKVVQQQNQFTVKGTVLDENNTPLAGASVVLKGTSEGVQTDFDGKFEFIRALSEGDVLVFSYLGYDKKEYVVSNSEVDNLTISITFEASDIELMGEVVLDQPFTSKRSIFQRIGSIFK